ncbi:efflux transporter periplasmic adaptor subunit [Yoonia sp.]|uniref:efflux RND transporter periplasmic adaptor subunit n=1 Tax=Yoonia sp. TaxID=2212373 RepID=UPI0019DF6FF2|nr:efflux transporter periplasmic adaptor subunit [Yoonia sp.]MBE0414433.1 efflux transporter periplasmic adaptor subunit [Yoonia sp.]
MRFLRRSLSGIFLLAITLTLLAWAGIMVRDAIVTRMNAEPRNFPQRERVFAVNVVTLTPQTIVPELTVFGELRSQRMLDLRSATGGTVLSASDALVEGGTVTAGQLLLRIDPVEAQAALDRVRADLQDAQAELRDAERALILAGDELAAARAQASLQDQALARARDLLNRGVGTAAAVENAELAASSAQASVLNRRQSVASAQARIDQATTRLARARINVAEAERALSDTEVFAAFDGALADVTISDGGRVTANERFAQLVDPTMLEVAFRVSTSQYARLLDGNGTLIRAPVSVALDVSGVNLRASGQITREGASVGTGQTGRLLFARLEAAPGFRPGDFVTVSIDEPALDNVALVPAAALAADGTVLVVGEDDRLESGSVTFLRRQGDNVIIGIGELAGATIVAERSPLLGTGIRVNPIRPGGAAAPAEPDMIALDDERRAKLVAYVTQSPMPDDVKARIIGQLQADEVSSETIARLESRMGS